MMAVTAEPSSLAIDPARREDLADVVRIEQVAWPAGDSLRAAPRTLAGRIEAGLMLVAREPARGRVVGYITTFRPTWGHPAACAELLSACPAPLLDGSAEARWPRLARRYGLPRDWAAATGGGDLRGGALHRADGAVVFGVGIATDPAVQGQGIAGALLRAAHRAARASGARYFVGYGRLPLFHRATRSPLDDYLLFAQRRPDGLAPHDLGLRVHWRAGARPAMTAAGRARYIGIPGAMPDDRESRGCGVLVVTPLEDPSVYPFERLVGDAATDGATAAGAARDRRIVTHRATRASAALTADAAG
jgi:predicted N-acetyltransferase YhbS